MVIGEIPPKKRGRERNVVRLDAFIYTGSTLVRVAGFATSSAELIATMTKGAFAMKRFWSSGSVLVLAAAALAAQQSAETPAEPKGLQERKHPAAGSITIPEGTHVPLVLINSISTKHAAPGDLIYLESVYPVVVDGRIVIPPGTYVSGSVTSAKRPGRVKGRGELFLRFEQMILPNGIIRDLIGRVGALDGRSPEGFDREEGKITSEGNKGSDARTVGETTAVGASIGVIAGAAGRRAGFGAGVGAAAGAAVGLAGVLLSRGPDAILEKGTQLDMVLARNLFFTDEELTFRDALRKPGVNVEINSGPDPDRNRRNNDGRLGRFPL